MNQDLWRQHRPIWSITAVVVVMAIGILLWRNTAEAPRPREISPEALVRRVMETLEVDWQGRRESTRVLVSSLAALAISEELETAETYYALGFSLRRQLRHEEAVEAYRKAIALRPDWSWPRNGMGIALYSLNQAEEAEEAFRAAIELDPEWSRPYNDLAIMLRHEGRLEEALPVARKAIELDPANLATHNNFGNLLVALERYDEAKEAYKRAIELDPTHPSPHYNMACLASIRSHVDDVFEPLAQAIQLDEVFRVEAKEDPDFDAVRDDPRFLVLVAGN